ncbi:hypothetical protein [Afipia felis]|uniref:Uncharacterized protein n=2 Tax=Afipia felis TaxID=1035 RepID=A0A380WE89_AFIFE|nr:hypothetical protein [Afipia felis]EKS29881.1 hypothetical protein HMPREF9697_02409 [Afipia felis ATCC 53690]SUU78588.1 Uncharacterised protein [Afipia felis]SUU86653.1 Uncharacterised protein [Afipia felis]
MSLEFEKLKQERATAFKKLQDSLQSTLGSHRATRLAKAGCRDSGTLLHDDIARRHARMLADDLKAMCESNAGSQDDLRFLTILHAVSPLSCDDALAKSSELERHLLGCLSSARVGCLAAVEFEVVNLSLLRKIKSRSNSETRKLDVLEKIGTPDIASGVLVHLHGVLNFSKAKLDADAFRAELRKEKAWSRSNYQIEIKNFHSGKPLAENLERIASYLTKGGNEPLKYNPGFGRDADSLLDTQIWRGKSGRVENGAEAVPDERGLTIGEIGLLDQIWQRQMATRDDNRGYLIETLEAP